MAEGENTVTLQMYASFSPCIVPLFLYHTSLSFNDPDKAFKNIVREREKMLSYYSCMTVIFQSLVGYNVLWPNLGHNTTPKSFPLADVCLISLK